MWKNDNMYGSFAPTAFLFIVKNQIFMFIFCIETFDMEMSHPLDSFYILYTFLIKYMYSKPNFLVCCILLAIISDWTTAFNCDLLFPTNPDYCTSFNVEIKIFYQCLVYDSKIIL